MDIVAAFTNKQQQREEQNIQHHQHQHQHLNLCLPLLKLRNFTKSNIFFIFGIWVTKSFQNLHWKPLFPYGFCVKGLQLTEMIVNHNSVFCAASGFSQQGKVEMEALVKINEDRQNGVCKSEAYHDECRESSSSSDFLTSEVTVHEEQSHSSSELSPHCSTSDITDDLDKSHVDNRKLEKQVFVISEIEMMKERFSKLLLGEDMSGCGNGVRTALAISNAITNLCATMFGQLWRLEPFPAEKKAMWRREIEWLLCVSDHIVEFIPSSQTFADGTKLEVMTCRPRSDIYVNLPALRKLDNMLIEILDSFDITEFWYVDQGILAPESDGSTTFHKALQRQEEKWWLPVPRVPCCGLQESYRKQLQHTRDCTNQILKAAMAINNNTLAEMEVPESYFEQLPKNGRASLGDLIYRYITSEQFSPECLLDCIDLSSEHQALEIANRVEASIYVWRRRNNFSVNGTNRSNSKSSWGMMKELMIDVDKRELLADRAGSLLLCLKQRFPGLHQTTLDMTKIQYNKDVGKSILESYSRVLESLAFNIVARIDDLLYVDDLTKHSDQFSLISKVGMIGHKNVSTPFSLPVSSTPYKTAYTTPSFSPAHLFSPSKGDRSPFLGSGKPIHRGFGVKKVLTDYLSIERKEKKDDDQVEVSDLYPNITCQALEPQTETNDTEYSVHADLYPKKSALESC